MLAEDRTIVVLGIGRPCQPMAFMQKSFHPLAGLKRGPRPVQRLLGTSQARLGVYTKLPQSAAPHRTTDHARSFPRTTAASGRYGLALLDGSGKGQLSCVLVRGR